MNKELKYFKSIAKLAVKYSGKYSPELPELKNDLKALKEGYKHLEGIIESVEGMIGARIDGMINDMTLRQNALESNYQALSQQQAESPVPAHAKVSKGADEYTASELQKICGYKSGQTLYNRIKSNNLDLKKRKEGNKVIYEVSSKELDVLRGSSAPASAASEDKGDWYDTKGMMKALKISSYQTFVNRAKANKIKIKTKRDGLKVLKYLPPEIIEKLSQDGRMPAGKDSQAKESVKPNMKDICYIAKELGVSRFVAKQRVDEHKIKALKDGRRLLYDVNIIKLLKQDSEASSKPVEKKNNLEKKAETDEPKEEKASASVEAKIPEKQDLPLFLKKENEIPSSKNISPYNHTSLDSLCRIREIGLKELIELINRLKIGVKYQDIDNKRKLYVLSDDATKISNEIVTERLKSSQ